MTATTAIAVHRRRAFWRKGLPYLLSLPALLVCIGILIPFFTAVFYSLQRYRLSQPWGRAMNWGETYLDFLSDPGFWNTLKVSLLYAGLTWGWNWCSGWGSRSSCRGARASTTSSRSCC